MHHNVRNLAQLEWRSKSVTIWNRVMTTPLDILAENRPAKHKSRL